LVDTFDFAMMGFMGKLKILFLAANPTDADTTALRLDNECREVGTRSRLAERDLVELASRWAVRTDDVIQALLEEKPHVVHFSGHGETDGLILEDSQGQSRTVTPAALLSVFRAIPDNLRLAVFNACDSLPLAKAAVKALDVAIGMKRPIGDDAAIAFAGALYQGIGFGRTVQESFDLALAALQMAGIPEDSTPRLVVKRGTDAKSLRLVLLESVRPARPASGAAALWREKLVMLLEAEAIETEAAHRFKLAKQIEEAKRKLNELGETT
jgi:CHAT domain-containing protein